MDVSYFSHVMRKPVFFFWPYANNKCTDQPAHPRSLISAFVIHCLDSIIPQVSISKISSPQLVSVAEQTGLSIYLVKKKNKKKLKAGDEAHLEAITCLFLLLSTWFWCEPPHDKTNKVACAPSEDSDQPGHPPSLIRIFAVRMKKAWVLSYPLSAQWRLWSDWADAQADRSLRWEHSHFVGFVMSQLMYRMLDNARQSSSEVLKHRNIIFILTVGGEQSENNATKVLRNL